MNLFYQRLPAQAFHPDWGQGWTTGIFTICPQRVRFESPLGVVEVPLDRVQAEVRVDEEERVVFTDPSTPGLAIVVVEPELLNCPVPPLQRARQALSDRAVRHETKKRLWILAWCALVIAGATWVGSSLTGYMVRAIAARVPAERDAQFGAETLAELQAEWKLLDDTNAVGQLAALAEPLLRVLPAVKASPSYQFHIIELEDPNAFALPGGHILVTTGMLKMIETEELLGVLAHEVAHVTQRHIYRQAIASAGPLTVCRLFMGRSQLGNLMAGGTALLIGAGFSQEYEAEADEVGWDYLIRANINPQGMIRMFRRLQAVTKEEGRDFTPQAFRSHPTTAKRIRDLEVRWSKLTRRSGFIPLPPHLQIEFAQPTRTP